MKTCNLCSHLSPTEKEQTRKKEPHMCTKYNERVFHHEYNGVIHEFRDPNIYPCEKCVLDDMLESVRSMPDGPHLIL